MHQTALVLFIRLANWGANSSIMREKKAPMATNRAKAVRKILRACAVRFCTTDSLIILDMATGMPPVEIISRMLKMLKAALKSA